MSSNPGGGMIVTLSLKYHPGLPSVSPIICKHFAVMLQEPYLKEVFVKTPIVIFNRPKNLREILIRAKLPTKSIQKTETRNRKPGIRHCGKRGDS